MSVLNPGVVIVGCGLIGARRAKALGPAKLIACVDLEYKRAETLAILKQKLNLHPVRNANIIEINVLADEADEAANIANEIAKVYRNRTASSDTATSTPDAFQVEIIDQATPALRPIRPDRPLNLAAAALVGLLFGIATGAARVTLFARKKQG